VKSNAALRLWLDRVNDALERRPIDLAFDLKIKGSSLA